MVAIGARFSDRSSGLPSELPETTKIIHIDIDPMEAGKNSRTRVRIVADAKKSLQLIIKGLGKAKGDSEWSMRMKKLREMCDCDMDDGVMPIHPRKVIYELTQGAEGRCLRMHRGGTEPDVGRSLPAHEAAAGTSSPPADWAPWASASLHRSG